jgi:hypothetical protein
VIAAEEVQAAIDKLTMLKAASTREPWSRSDELWDGAGRWEIVSPGGLVSSDGDGIGSFNNQADADLIVTLHSTIDAQIYWLKSVVERIHPKGIERSGNLVWASEGLAAQMLARAINEGSL